jgi:hypothetical protein
LTRYEVQLLSMPRHKPRCRPLSLLYRLVMAVLAAADQTIGAVAENFSKV